MGSYRDEYRIRRRMGYSPDKARRMAKKGCYIATAVYGSYDCPEVWTLRRFRDNKLSETWTGRLFIRLYYIFSPIAVRIFGNAKWFKRFWRAKLDKMVKNLNKNGFDNSPYTDNNLENVDKSL